MSRWKEVQPWEAMRAFDDGVHVQVLRKSGWIKKISESFELGDSYRIEVPSKIRPMKFEELPPVGTPVMSPSGDIYLLTHKPAPTDEPDKLVMVTLSEIGSIPVNALFENLFEGWTYSLDGEKTWLPFGVEEEDDEA